MKNMDHDTNTMKCFDIWYVDLPELPTSHVQAGYRPVIVVSNDWANRYSPCVTVIPVTSKLKRMDHPIKVFITDGDCGLRMDSVADCEQITTVDKSRFTKRLGRIESPEDRAALHRAMAIQLAMVGRPGPAAQPREEGPALAC